MTAVQDSPEVDGSGLLRRPTAETGWRSWFTTVDHKKIGILYFLTSFIFFLVAGAQGLALRVQLTGPDQDLLSADQFNQLFTMHGVSMVFLVGMPMAVAFMNYVLPLQIGARDVAFPRLNALSYWIFLLGGLFLYSSIFLGGLPDGGWFGYGPLHTVTGDPGGYLGGDMGHRMMFYSLGLQITGVGTLMGAINFIVTILNMRAPGMRLMRMPMFAWMSLVTSFIMLFAMPVLAVALWMLMFDGLWGTAFFDPAGGGDPVLWQHLFWIFGHPEVYILILPVMGIISEVLPTFSRKPLFGFNAVVFSGIAIGLLGWGVWAHHMFTSGLGPVANTAFGLATMLIAIPTGVKIFNWLGTLWGGRIWFTTATLFAVGFIAMFVIGGLSGVTHAVVPHNWQQHDSYYVVAHFHYVLFGGTIFGFMAGLYYWFPKVTGRLLNEGLGKAHFWLMFAGFNLTFFPMHILGLQGMPRRVDTYPEGMGWELMNQLATVGGFVIAISVLVLMVNLVKSIRGGEPGGDDPWDGRTLEWSIPSPVPKHNFTTIPQVTSRDELWVRKHGGGGQAPTPAEPVAGGSDEPEAATGADAGHDEDGEGIHLPNPSFWPLVLAVGLPVMGYGVLYSTPVLLVGALITFVGAFGWVHEPSEE